MFPDIIVHKRGGEGPNLLAVELKIEGRPGEECDIAKLQGYISNIEGILNRFEKVIEGQKDSAEEKSERKSAKKG